MACTMGYGIWQPLDKANVLSLVLNYNTEIIMIKYKAMANNKIWTALLCFYLFSPIFALANTADAISMVS